MSGIDIADPRFYRGTITMSLHNLVSHLNQAAEILESVNRIRARYHRETGMRLPIDEAYRMHCLEPDPDDVFPDRKALVPAKLILIEKGYTQVAIAGAIADIARDGTAQCSSWVDPEDRDELEAAIPGSAWQWGPETDAVHVNLGPNAEPIDGVF